jgi:hypothetical protein
MQRTLFRLALAVGLYAFELEGWSLDLRQVDNPSAASFIRRNYAVGWFLLTYP